MNQLKKLRVVLVILIWAVLSYPHGYETVAVSGLALEDIMLENFDGGNFGKWQVRGKAFGEHPVNYDNDAKKQDWVHYFDDGRKGGFVASWQEAKNRNQGTGELLSPEYKIERRYLNIEASGGRYAREDVGVEVIVDGQVVGTAPNAHGDYWNWNTIDLQKYQERAMKIRIFAKKEERGGWGHISVDKIVLSDQPKVLHHLTRTMLIENRYLWLPIDNKATISRLTITIDGKPVQGCDIAIAPGDPDWWAFFDFNDYIGKKATLELGQLQVGQGGLKLIKTENRIPYIETLYQEPGRPQFHFSQLQGWNNDVNGLIYYKGEWHLGWQSNPVGLMHQNMYCGHAVSKDLVHWTELNPSLKPFIMAKGACFSGSGAVDNYNTAGFQTGDEKPLILMFTDTGRGESIAYSNDRGRTWVYYENNPVISPDKHRGRDPHLFWYEPDKHWVAVVYDEKREGYERGLAFYVSKDLKKWELTDLHEGYYECPAFFELPVLDKNGKPTGGNRWILFDGSTRYSVGTFDGHKYTPDNLERYQYIYGDYYASQVWRLGPKKRVIQIGWIKPPMSGLHINMGFSIQTELTLHETDEGLRIFAYPIEELNQLREENTVKTNIMIEPGKTFTLPVNCELFDMVGIINGDGTDIQFENKMMRYKGEKVNTAPATSTDGIIHFRLLVDRPTIEMFWGLGQSQHIETRTPGKPVKDITITNTGNRMMTIERIELYRMKSIWNDSVIKKETK